MVTTRRGGQRAESHDSSQDTGPSTSSQRTRTGAGRTRGRPAAQAGRARSLEPVEENAALVSQEQPAVAGAQEEPVSQPREERQDEPTAAGGDQVGSSDAATVPTTVQEASSSDDEASDGSTGSDGDDADSDEDNIVGPNLMGQLASSLRAALRARAGGPDSSREPSAEPQLACAPEQKLGLASDPEAIRWQQDTERPKERPTTSQRVAPGTVAEKEKGLAKQLLAPPRSKAADDGSAADKKRWFELPTTKITDEVKQELRLLRLRGAYDPKRFYKTFDETKFPKRFQIGTVLDNPQDFYSSRLAARERGSTIAQELLADPAIAAARKKRYNKLQEEATRYQKVKKRKTDLVRANPKPKRPKH